MRFQSGARRSGTLTVDNWSNIYDINANKVWFGQRLRISAGIILPDGTEFYLPQGVFYISNPQEVLNPSSRQTTFSLVDKWGYLDGTLFGNYCGIYQLLVGNNLFDATRQLLLTDRGNGHPIDSAPPILSSSYIGKSYVSNGQVYYYTDCPYTAKISGTYADVLNEINTMLVAVAGYDVHGQYCLEPANTDSDNLSRQTLWDFAEDQNSIIRAERTTLMTDTYNHVIVTGGTLNGHIARGEACNIDPGSPTNVNLIGKKTLVIEQNKYYADAQCTELARYELSRRNRLLSNVNITCMPIYHLQENKLVNLSLDSDGASPKPYLISEYTLPISQTGYMDVSVSAV